MSARIVRLSRSNRPVSGLDAQSRLAASSMAISTTSLASAPAKPFSSVG